MAFLREMKRTDKNGREYSYWVIVKTYRDRRTQKVKHKVLQPLGRLSSKEVETMKLLCRMKDLKQDTLVTNWEKIKINDSYDFLTVVVCDYLYRMWEIEKVIDRNEKLPAVEFSKAAEILVINQTLSPNSDYKVSSWYQTTVLPKLLKVEPSLINHTRIYRTLDVIFDRQREIQKHLGNKITSLGFDDFSLVLYDITSSYLEGYKCPLAKFGLSREHRKDRPQILLALCVTKEGFPFYWRVLNGNIYDSKTVEKTVSEIKKRFYAKEVCLIMDKGMVNKMNLEKIENSKFYYLVTIKRTIYRNFSSFPKSLLSDISEELEKEKKKKKKKSPVNYQQVMKKFPYFTFHSKRAYFHLLEEKEDNCRYILCFNPEKFIEERKQREEKINSIEKHFMEYNQKLSRAKKTKNKKDIEKELYAYLKKRKSLNLFHLQFIPKRKREKKKFITTYQIKYRLNLKKLNLLKMTDGTYCLKTNLSQQQNEKFLVSSYQQRRKIEVSFHYLKSFIEIRPLYHQKEERIKAHVTICILAYLLQITVEYLLKKKGIDISFQQFISKLQQKRAVDIEIKNMKENRLKFPEIPQELKTLLSALGIDDKQISSLKNRM